jgi:parvulin-like peptidyl-prolyl isomerase
VIPVLSTKHNPLLTLLAAALVCAALCAPCAAADGDTVYTVGKTAAYTVDQLSTAWRTEIPEQTKFQYLTQQDWQSRFVDNWIQVSIMAEKGRQNKIQESEKFKQTWHIREASLTAGRFFEKVIAPELAKVKASDEDIKAYYEKNKDTAYFTGWREASHIIVTDKDLADKLYAELSKDPSKFADAAKENSLDESTKQDGGAVGRITGSDERFPPEVMPAYIKTPVGKVCEPARSRFGWHLVLVTAASKPEEDYQPLDDKLIETIRPLANAEKQQAAALAAITEQLAKLNVTVDDKAVPDIARDWINEMKKMTGDGDTPDDGKKPDPKTVVATLGKPGIQITLAELDLAWTQEMNDNFKSQLITQQNWQRAFLDRWIEVAALSHLTREQKLDQAPDFQNVLKVKKDSLLATMYFEQFVNPELDKLTVAEADVKTWYDQNKEKHLYAGWREASHILVESKEKIDELYAKLQKNPEKFAELANENSIDPGNKGQGGALGRISKGQFVPEAEQAVFSTPVGKMSAPVQTQFGWHIFLVTAASDPKDDYMPYTDELKEQISARLLTEKRRASFMELIEATRREMDVKVNEAAVAEVAAKWAEEVKKNLPPMSPQQ